MEIHKPKPWHGVREFLKEYAIIVVGVLTALAAEQLVEAVHWAERVESAETRMGRELGVSYMFALERSMVSGCLDRRLVSLKTALLSSEGKWEPLGPMRTPVLGDKAFVIPARYYEDQVWKAVEADGTVGHLAPSLSAGFARAYSMSDVVTGKAAAEVVDVATLNLLNNRTNLPLPQRLELIAKIEQEQVRSALAGIQTRQLMSKIKVTTRIDEAKAQAWVLRISNTYNACAGLGLLDANAPRPQLAADPTAAANEYPDVTLH